MTYLVFPVVLVTVISFATQPGQQPQNGQQKNPRPDQQESLLRVLESRRGFPSADYNESEPVDPGKSALRKEKQKRYNTFQMVSKDPGLDTAEVSVVLERPDLPVIPLGESSVVIIGDVEGAEAHLSANKQNVFCEFTVRIKEVLKSPTALSPDTL
jgi:hypothetical protein